MRTLLNILWNVPGLGFVAAFCWALAGLVMAVTIIGLPWAKACFTLASYTLAPFGRELASRRDVTGYPSLGTGGLGLLANVVWFLLAGWWLIVLHVVAACACAITVIGIPFAWAHMKIAAAAMAPVGKVVVPGEVAAEIERERQGNRSRTSACTLQNSVEVIGVPSSDLAADLEALAGFG